jgi:Protein of unknown function (DUF4236)
MAPSLHLPRVADSLRVNLFKSGASLSIGHRGAWYTIGPRGRRRVTLGLPGCGLWWTETVPPARAPHAGHRLAFVIVVVAVLVAIYWAALAGGGSEGWATR